MYERFTDNARAVIQHGNQEGHRFLDQNLCTEHLLAGLIKVYSPTIVRTVLAEFDISLRSVRLAIERLKPVDREEGTHGRLEYSENAKKVIERVLQIAKEYEDIVVRTQYLFLSLLVEEGTTARQILSEHEDQPGLIERQLRELIRIDRDLSAKTTCD